MLSIFADDGYTLTGTIPAKAGLFPEVTITYRPAVPSVRTKYLSAKPDDMVKAGADLIEANVESFDVGGQKVKVVAAQAVKLHADLYHAVLNYVLGYADPNPPKGGPEGNSGGG